MKINIWNLVLSLICSLFPNCDNVQLTPCSWVFIQTFKMNGDTQMSTKTYNTCQEKKQTSFQSKNKTSKETKNHTLLNPQQPHYAIFCPIRHSFHLQPLPISWDPMRIKVQSCHNGMTRARGLSHHGILRIVLSHGLAHASQITLGVMEPVAPKGVMMKPRVPFWPQSSDSWQQKKKNSSFWFLYIYTYDNQIFPPLSTINGSFLIS